MLNFSACQPFPNENVWNDLSSEGFGGSLSGEPSSTIYIDLITEVTINQEIKVRGGQMMCGYSTSDGKIMNLLKQVMSWQKSDQS